MATDDLLLGDVERQQWGAHPSSLCEPPEGSAPARPEFLTIDEVLELGLTVARLAMLAAIKESALQKLWRRRGR